MNSYNTLTLNGIDIQRMSLVYDTREVFRRFSNYLVRFDEAAAYEILERLELWSDRARPDVLRVSAGSQDCSSMMSIVFDEEICECKTIGLFERISSQGNETCGELVIHLSSSGLKVFMNSLKSLKEAAQAGSDFDFRFHPFECDYISSGSVALTICCGSEWIEKMHREATIPKNPNLEPVHLSALEYLQAARRFASLK